MCKGVNNTADEEPSTYCVVLTVYAHFPEDVVTSLYASTTRRVDVLTLE